MSRESVVSIQGSTPGVAVIHMQDRASKNSFSPALVSDLREAFRTVQALPGYRVVVLTGYESYFCSGGTKEELLAIHAGKLRFNELPVYDLALQCELPVISAMQGHAVGGGLVMGLYADFVVLGRECLYTANFMNFGFTPGMGATMMLPLRLGAVLGAEMMYSGESFRGGELQERGCPLRVVPRKDVLSCALQLAGALAAKPRLALVTLKQHLARPLREQLDDIVRQELAMHEVTFHQPEVAEKIAEHFG
jgi:polyketide biosynthesis enoyl-CoA hydratase PksI